MNRFVVVLLMLFTAVVPASYAQAGAGARDHRQIADLLARLGNKAARFDSLKTDFVQVKKLAVFKNEITLRGRIYLQKPDRVAWHVDAPVRYSVYMDSTVVRQWDEDTDKVQTVSLAGNPVFKNVLGQLTVWFSGDYRSLLDGNDVSVVRDAPLVLRFSPKPSNFAGKVIRSITITYRQDGTYLRRIAIEEKNGDSTVITFTNTVVNVPLAPRDFEVKRRG